jgi:hypothetical protein
MSSVRVHGTTGTSTPSVLVHGQSLYGDDAIGVEAASTGSGKLLDVGEYGVSWSRAASRAFGLVHALADHGARVAPNFRKQHLAVVLGVALTIAMFP